MVFALCGGVGAWDCIICTCCMWLVKACVVSGGSRHHHGEYAHIRVMTDSLQHVSDGCKFFVDVRVICDLRFVPDFPVLFDVVLELCYLYVLDAPCFGI